MSMDEGLDTGDVLLQKRIEIAPDETGGSLHDRLAAIAAAALREALRELKAERLRERRRIRRPRLTRRNSNANTVVSIGTNQRR